jgi:uncharacterized protein YegP (UPF0339 family)
MAGKLHFEVYKTGLDVGDTGPLEYRWRLRAANGEIIAQSEGYTTKRACMESIELVENARGAPVEEVN